MDEHQADGRVRPARLTSAVTGPRSARRAARRRDARRTSRSRGYVRSASAPRTHPACLVDLVLERLGAAHDAQPPVAHDLVAPSTVDVGRRRQLVLERAPEARLLLDLAERARLVALARLALPLGEASSPPYRGRWTTSTSSPSAPSRTGTPPAARTTLIRPASPTGGASFQTTGPGRRPPCGRARAHRWSPSGDAAPRPVPHRPRHAAAPRRRSRPGSRRGRPASAPPTPEPRPRAAQLRGGELGRVAGALELDPRAVELVVGRAVVELLERRAGALPRVAPDLSDGVSCPESSGEPTCSSRSRSAR